jgi:hypothetical protein
MAVNLSNVNALRTARAAKVQKTEDEAAANLLELIDALGGRNAAVKALAVMSDPDSSVDDKTQALLTIAHELGIDLDDPSPVTSPLSLGGGQLRVYVFNPTDPANPTPTTQMMSVADAIAHRYTMTSHPTLGMIIIAAAQNTNPGLPGNNPPAQNNVQTPDTRVPLFDHKGHEVRDNGTPPTPRTVTIREGRANTGLEEISEFDNGRSVVKGFKQKSRFTRLP